MKNKIFENFFQFSDDGSVFVVFVVDVKNVNSLIYSTTFM